MRDTVGNLLVFGLLAILAGMFVVTITYSYDQTNITVRANITQSMPTITSIIIDEGINPSNNITLTQGAYRIVHCNVSVIDYNGYGDVIYANATLFHNSTYNWSSAYNSTSPDDNNTHYTNWSCANIGNDGLYTSYWGCDFSVAYYAYNGSWACNATVMDNYNYTGTYVNSTKFEQLFAINVTDVIDYGEIAVMATSTEKTANITNFGNMKLNITVFGYARNQNDNLSMICEVGNISIRSQHFSPNASVAFNDKQNLTNVANWISYLTIPQQTDDAVPVTNVTYWQLYVPPNPFGVCNGTVVFEATASS